MTKQQKKAFIKDILKATKKLCNKVIDLEANEQNLFREIELCLKTVEQEVGK